MIHNILSIAGTDPGGGAGMSADLKTFGALGTYGTSVVTAVVDQNTRGVFGVHQLTGEFVGQQLRHLLDDVRIDAVKIGMLGSADVVRSVAAVLEERRPPYVVLDPVMLSTSGDRLLEPDAVAELRRLMPCCDLVTPNLPEAADLLGCPVAEDETAMHEQLGRLGTLARGVLLKGGHLQGPTSVDLLQIDGEVTRLSAARIPTRNTHGTGCTLSAAVAALRPRHAGWLPAVQAAKDYLTAALRASDRLDVGSGPGPTHHFHALWPHPDGAILEYDGA
jgi:hydroxymethylpyrimidine/phosphomethylpyrimidine kinase